MILSPTFSNVDDDIVVVVGATVVATIDRWCSMLVWWPFPPIHNIVPSQQLLYTIGVFPVFDPIQGTRPLPTVRLNSPTMPV